MEVVQHNFREHVQKPTEVSKLTSMSMYMPTEVADSALTSVSGPGPMKVS
jgi:hypothetical protein